LLYSEENIIDRSCFWRRNTKNIVFTNGCFDLLHKGHKELLKKAKSLGDILIVGLNSDYSVRKIKGEKRPIETETIRAKKLIKLEYVDAVCIFREETPIKLIKSIRPHFLVKGGDYKKGDIVGSDIIQTWGGKIIIIPLIKGYSTTLIIEKNKREGLV